MKETILLVEDDKIMRISLEDALKGVGYEVMSFETGATALDMLKNTSFDLAITDIRLPDIDGFDIVQEISGTKDSPVIVMTAYGTIKDAVEAMKLGAFDYLLKPCDIDTLVAKVKEAAQKKRSHDEKIEKAVDAALDMTLEEALERKL